MKEVKVLVSELLETVKTNRSGHRAEFEKAFEGYKKAVVGALGPPDSLILEPHMKLKVDQPFIATLEEWREWRVKAKEEHPVRYFLTECIPDWWGSLSHRVRNVYWWIQHRVNPRRRYHVCRTGLKPGYHDKDTLLLHVSFQLLKDFVEREKPFENFDMVDSPHKAEWSEVAELYDWWTKTRPARKDPEPPSEPGCLLGDPTPETLAWAEECNCLEAAWDIADQVMLHRLVDIRLFLWT